MAKVATYDDLLAEIEAQNAYTKQLEQERGALQKELAELRADAAKPRMEWFPMPGVSQFEITEALRKARETEAGRVPLMEGWYVRDEDKAIAWMPTEQEAIASKKQYCEMTELEEIARDCGLSLTPADFIPLREAYYAQ